jgi:hypothetical protein
MATSLNPEDIRVLHAGTVVRPFNDGGAGVSGSDHPNAPFDGDLSDDDDWDLWDGKK